MDREQRHAAMVTEERDESSATVPDGHARRSPVPTPAGTDPANTEGPQSCSMPGLPSGPLNVPDQSGGDQSRRGHPPHPCPGCEGSRACDAHRAGIGDGAPPPSSGRGRPTVCARPEGTVIVTVRRTMRARGTGPVPRWLAGKDRVPAGRKNAGRRGLHPSYRVRWGDRAAAVRKERRTPGPRRTFTAT
jgi:hypothetical protein